MIDLNTFTQIGWLLAVATPLIEYLRPHVDRFADRFARVLAHDLSGVVERAYVTTVQKPLRLLVWILVAAVAIYLGLRVWKEWKTVKAHEQKLLAGGTGAV
ncbi:hypothetical protein [Methanocella conradii]|uniref:hypothetical protein n=1 Tax=Methanocella conradii TaxID=1175444 RepID=UPI00157D5AFF|nr:hypothetical protein [Methanocella conradii]